ncbi:MAG: hypothetical protein P8X90_22240 [Desulfobacterales bacterium]
MKKLLLYLIILFDTFILIGNCFAAEIAWLQVQHREYGTGKSLNRLSFGLVDEETNYVTSKAAVNSVRLIDPSGSPVALAPAEFGAVEEIYGNYDAKNSQWYFDPSWQYDSWFSVDIEAPLTAGSYVLSVTTADGQNAECAYTFNQQVELPIIDSDSIRLESDSGGNLIWTWRIPEQLGRLSLNHPMRARASIDIYNKDRYTGYFSIILPVHLGFVFVPREVAEKINQKGNRFEVMISLETRDKNNRTYSKPRTINQVPPRS